MPVATLAHLIQVVSFFGSVLVAFRLYTSGLYRQYPVFFAYFLFRIPDSIWPLLLSSRSNTYFYLWIATEPFTWIFQVLVVLELYRLILSKHRGLYTLGRWAMYVGVGVSVVLSILSLIPKFTPSIPQRSRVMGYYLGAERGVTLGLAIFLVVMIFFLSRYPVPMSRNLMVHAGVFSIFFFSNYLAWLLRSVFGITVNVQVSLSVSAISAVCTFAWFFLLTAKGEEVPASLPSFGAEYEQRALEQLNALNATLLKISRN
jgi:hypothetical protein